MQKECFTCHSCDKRVEFTPEEPPCMALSGWLMLSHWQGLESVDHYTFCSLTCLRRWLNAQVPQIPEAFLKSFGEKE